MLVIHDVETIDKEKLNVIKKKYKKKQIVLYDTKRRLDDFVNKLKYRREGEYGDIPHFLVSKLGVIYQVFDPNHHSTTFNDEKLDRKQIKIAVENLGWLNKNTISGMYNNWIGDPYRAEPYIKGWRDRFYWDRYSEVQMKSVVTLCDKLCIDHKIDRKVLPSTRFIENVEKFDGILCKSNFSNIYTDINPSFDFKLFLEDEL